MLSNRREDRKFILQFIDLYRQYPTLWKVKSKEYSNRNEKNEAYKILVQKYQEFDAKADKETVKKKINSLRTNYRKELKKVKDSYIKTVPSTNDVYEPTLWYFKELSFLEDQEMHMKDLSTVTSEDEDGNEEEEDVGQQEHNLCIKQEIDIEDETIASSPTPAPKRKKRKIDNLQSDLLALTYHHLQKPDGEYESIARTWANELKKIKPEQQIYAKKAINDILFEGQLGTLHRQSVIININKCPSTST